MSPSDAMPDSSGDLPDREQQSLQDLVAQIGRRLQLALEMPSLFPDAIPLIETALGQIRRGRAGDHMLLVQLLQWLSRSLLDTPEGNREDNIERAIATADEALAVLPPGPENDFSRALLLNTLAAAYDERLRGGTAANREHALELYRQALRLYPRNQYPLEWAEIQENMAILYQNRIVDSSAANREFALLCHEEALTVYTRKDYPDKWGTVQHNLGSLYLERVVDDHAANIKKAIDCFENALDVLEYAPSMDEFVKIEVSLGTAFAELATVQGTEQTEHFQRARMYFDDAAHIYDENKYPAQHRDVQLDIAYLEAAQAHWVSAEQAYSTARRLEARLVRQAAGSAPRDRVLRQGRDAAIRHGFVLTRLGRLEEAAVEIERGRLQELVEMRLIRGADAHRIRDTALRQRFERAREELFRSQSQLYEPLPRTMTESEERAYVQSLNSDYRRRRDEFDEVVRQVRDQDIRHSSSGRGGVQFLVDPLDASMIHSAAECGGARHALVYLIASPWGGIALASLPPVGAQAGGRRFDMLDLHDLTDELVRDLVETRLNAADGRRIGGFAYAQEGSGCSSLLNRHIWFGGTLGQRIETLGAASDAAGRTSTLYEAAQQALSISGFAALADTSSDDVRPQDEALLEATVSHYFLQAELKRCLPVLGNASMEPLISWLRGHGITTLSMVPCGALATFPLGATILADGSTVSEVLPCSVIPSARQLTSAYSASVSRTGVYALGDTRPERSETMLPWAEAEARTFVRVAQEANIPAEVSVQNRATRDWLIQKLRTGLVIDAACHGYFDQADFLHSALQLANGEELTLGSLFGREVTLDGLRLLVLSACQTAILDLRGAPDEVRSLTVGVLDAGCKAVLAALWPVDDRATYLLVARFAQIWLPRLGTMAPAEALAAAQQWLRTVTTGELRHWEAFSTRSVSVASTPSETGKPEYTSVRGRSMRYEGLEAQSMIRLQAERVASADPTARPYADPIFWAGFQIYGW